MRRAARAVLAVALLGAMALHDPLPAGAQLTGGCTATVSGIDVNSAKTASTAITVNENDTITVVGTAPGPITSYKVFLNIGPFRFQAAEGTVSDGKTTYTSQVNVKDYAKYGVGIYQVDGETTGTACSVWAYVKVTGPFPLTTAAGIASLVLTLAGLAGMATSLRRRTS